ncbi:MAG: hypothetical protein HC903_28115 [Methylacidiphilales bacterium]|nr:hypothetical protein [Candidatus Methylacidiphilales bacterium]
MVHQGNIQSDMSLTLEERSRSLQSSYSIMGVLPNKRSRVTAVTTTSESSTTDFLIDPSARLSPFFHIMTLNFAVLLQNQQQN